MSAERREPAEGERPQDLALDLVGFGLRQVDVGADHRGSPRPGRPAAGPSGPPGARRPAARCPGWADRDPGVVLRVVGVRSGDRLDYSSARCAHPSSTLAPWPMQPRFNRPAGAGRGLVTAELLAIGTELTVGETTDTNSGELARSMVAPGRDGRPDLEPAGRPRDGRRRAAYGARPRGPRRDHRAASVRRPTTSPARPSRRPAASGRWSTRPRSSGCAGCGRVAGSRSRRPTLKQAWIAALGRCSRTPTGRRPAGGSTGPTAGSSSRCPGRRARCGRCGRTRSQPRLAARGVGRRDAWSGRSG